MSKAKQRAYEAARELGNRAEWPAPHRWTADTHVRNLRLKASLREWVETSTGEDIHRAILAGATVQQVCENSGWLAATVLDIWRTWALARRRAYDKNPMGNAGIDRDQYAAVAAVLGPAAAAEESAYGIYPDASGATADGRNGNEGQEHAAETREA